MLELGNSASASPTAPHVIDRTFGCIPVSLDADIRAVEVNAVPVRTIEVHDPFQKRSPGFIGVASGGWEPGSELVSIRARGWQRFTSTYSAAGVYASTRCTPSRISVTLSARGLPRPPVRSVKQATCLGRGRVIIRVRAKMQEPALWQPLTSASYDGARGRIVEAAIAIRSERTGKPIAYVELDRNGKTKLWYSQRCVK